MRIAFVAANRERLPDPVVPLGLLYVKGSVAHAHETILIDLCWEDDPEATLRARLAAFAPDLVAMGLRNLQNADYTGTRDNLEYYARLMRAIRATTAAPVVLGGGGFSVLARGLMKRLQPDFGILGEAERSFPELVARLQRGHRDFSGVSGLHYFAGDALVAEPLAADFVELDHLARPARTRVDVCYYSANGIDSVQTKRGCTLACEYCTYPLIEGRRVRTRAPGLVVDELLAARAEQPLISHFFIVDSVFTLPPEHAKAVCREMAARGFATPWTCYASPLGFDQELATLMAQAGCTGMEIGSDSGSDAVLTRLRKGFDTAAIRAMSAVCKETGLRDCHTFVLGTSGESLDDVRHSLAFLDTLDPFAAILMIWTDDEEALSPELTAERLDFRQAVIGLVAEATAVHPRWIVPALFANYDPRLFRLLRRRGLTGPLWQYVDRVEPKKGS